MLSVLGPDGITRSFEEHYDTVVDVEQDPTGALHAIHSQAEEIERLRYVLMFYGGLMPVSFAPGQDGGFRARDAVKAATVKDCLTVQADGTKSYSSKEVDH